MAAISASSTLHSFCRPTNHHLSSTRLLPLSKTPSFRIRTTVDFKTCSIDGFQKQNRRGMRKMRSTEGGGEEGVAVAEEEQQPQQLQDTVSVPVSPSDTLTMFFQADGTLNETAIPKVTKALEDIEGVSNLKVRVTEGIATVELMKQTTVQATGVASSLVELIQGVGFKLQTLNLSFEDEDEVLV
ncbi:PREDICTED: uncharacterized protein LOC104821069 [Tarenaya hassleriana]|uniref:uncharacterized protein LOC104821069 n=1 Tax=Tarenaya hassleriana TaxID=28532 RepID=UPI00053C6DBD|nr:PREDICTED: uncharacterized protein LOC104821069 [Tarenaya hassleriana]